MVAEQVEKVDPNLVARDEQGKPYTVRYEAVNAMVLNEFLKVHTKVEGQQRKIEQQDAVIAELKSALAQQQKAHYDDLAALRQSLNQQAAQVQKVTARLTANEAAPRLVSGK